MDSLFFQLHMIREADSSMTAMQREMLRMTLEANPGVTLGDAVKDVFDFLKVKIKPKRLEAVCRRLIEENEQRLDGVEPEIAADPDAPPEQRKGSGFGQELIQWIEGMHASERLLAAVHYNVELAQRIYCEQDYLVTDTICTLYLQDRWNDSLIALQAAAAPWGGGGGARGDVETIDLSNAEDDDPRWKELARAFGPA